MIITAPRFLNEAVIELPLSKSVANRMMIISSLAGNETIMTAPENDDSITMQELLMKLRSSTDNQTYNVGHAGTVFRFLCAVLSITPGEHVLTGSSRMLQRPCSPLVDALVKLGADIEFMNVKGYPPLKIKGNKLQGGEISIDSTISSQFISALMMIAPTLHEGLTIKLSGKPVSLPYIYLTAGLMERSGVRVEIIDQEIRVPSGDYNVKDDLNEADWSAASYWYSLVALVQGSKIVLRGLNPKSLQGDSVVARIYSMLGVDSTWHDNDLVISNNMKVTPNLTLDLKDCPDIAPTIAVTCAGLQIEARLTGLETLVIKESNRLTAIESELAKLGYRCNAINNNTLQLHVGINPVTSKVIETYQDHRIAMSMAVLSAVAGSIIINKPDVVNKSYTLFWQHLESTGFSFGEV